MTMTTYTGAEKAAKARETLGGALAALQSDPEIPPDVLSVTANIASAVGALFEAERASSEIDGKGCAKHALSSLSQTLALLQDVKSQHHGIAIATESIAGAMTLLFPLTTAPTRYPGAISSPAESKAPSAKPPETNLSSPPAGSKAPSAKPPETNLSSPPAGSKAPSAKPPETNLSSPPAGSKAPSGKPPETNLSSPPAGSKSSGKPASVSPLTAGSRTNIEANIGAATETNFFVGFSGEIAEGGVFIATYMTLEKGTPLEMLLTLPGGFEMRLLGNVRFVRDPMDFSTSAEPGMGVTFESVTDEQRKLMLRFIAKRPPIFYDD
ncbi:MAG: PilZ domain-containing protein [Myxococcales bacterium]|nr:PilZ domain-containing protein [Myxococcales bacterium]